MVLKCLLRVLRIRKGYNRIMIIKAIIWDIGGVLVRTEDRAPRARLAEKLGLTYSQLDDLVFNSHVGQRAQIGQKSTQEVWHWVASTLDQPKEKIAALQTAFFAGDQLDKDLVDKIRAWHGTYRTGIITNAFDNARQLIKEEWKMQDAFDHIVVSAEVGMMKPDPRIFRLALEGMEVDANQAVFVDDFLHNVQGAREVGMHAVHFRSQEQVLGELNTLLNEGGLG